MLYGGLNTSDYSDGEVVFFIRIKGADHFFRSIYGQATINRLFGHLQFKPTLSEYNNADHVIDLSKVKLHELTPEDYELYRACVHNDLGAVIARCRGLRDIEYSEARSLILRMTCWSRRFLKAQQFRLLVIHIIDSYVLDVLVRVMRFMNLDVLVLSEWFIQPYRRHTFYGELWSTREPQTEEVKQIARFCEKPQQVFWLNGMDRTNRILEFFYLYLRSKVLLLTRYFLQYKIFGCDSYETRFAHIISKIRISNLFVGKYFQSVSESELIKAPESFVVIPLHTYPEANVDYWMNDWRDADYYTSLYEVISFFRAESITVLLKEHPGFLYQRESHVYKTLASFENVRIIDPYSSSAQLLDQVPLVVVWHGTMGIEGVMRNRKVAVFDNTYYNDGLLPTYKNYRQAKVSSAEQKESFIRKLLSGVERV